MKENPCEHGACTNCGGPVAWASDLLAEGEGSR
jgi:hypothetical protein